MLAVPALNAPEHVAAAETLTRQLNAPFLGVMLEGKYSDWYLDSNGKDAPQFTDDDLKVISEPVDLVGLNIYRVGDYVLAADNAEGHIKVPFNASHPHMLSPWHEILMPRTARRKQMFCGSSPECI